MLPCAIFKAEMFVSHELTKFENNKTLDVVNCDFDKEM